MTTYALWWISADGQHAVETDYPAARYATVEAAEEAIAEACEHLLEQARETYAQWGVDETGAILAGRFSVEAGQ